MYFYDPFCKGILFGINRCLTSSWTSPCFANLAMCTESGQVKPEEVEKGREKGMVEVRGEAMRREEMIGNPWRSPISSHTHERWPSPPTSSLDFAHDRGTFGDGVSTVCEGACGPALSDFSDSSVSAPDATQAHRHIKSGS